MPYAALTILTILKKNNLCNEQIVEINSTPVTRQYSLQEPLEAETVRVYGAINMRQPSTLVVYCIDVLFV